MAPKAYHLVSTRDQAEPAWMTDSQKVAAHHQQHKPFPAQEHAGIWKGNSQHVAAALRRRNQAEQVAEEAIGLPTAPPPAPRRKRPQPLPPHHLVKLGRFRLLFAFWSQPGDLQQRLNTFVPKRRASRFLLDREN